MAISDAYATAAQYRAITNKPTTDEDSEIGDDLKAVSRYIDGKLGRFFTVDAADVTRIHIVDGVFTDADGSPILTVPDLSAAPTTVKIDTDHDGSFADETALVLNTDYEVRPINAALGPEAWPYTQLALLPWRTRGEWAIGERVQIIAKFGWPSVPSAIVRATAHLTAILRIESPRAQRRISEIEGTLEASDEAQTIVRQLLVPYKRNWFY